MQQSSIDWGRWNKLASGRPMRFLSANSTTAIPLRTAKVTITRNDHEHNKRYFKTYKFVVVLCAFAPISHQLLLFDIISCFPLS